MDTNVIHILETCTRASEDATLLFPQIVGMLIQVGVEQYHADLQRSEKTYYLPDGQSYVVACTPSSVAIAEAFDAQAVEAAIRASQAKQIVYAEFIARIAAAGCTSYFVSMAGKRAVYFGRTAESHVEHFPMKKE